MGVAVSIVGRIEKVFGTSGNHWASVLIAGKDGKMYRAAGKIEAPMAGYDIRINGEWDTHKVYGKQIKVSDASVTQASSAAGILKYLEDQIDNIGPKLAEKIVAEFGDDTLRIIEEEPEKLIAIPGISQARADKIATCHKESKIYLKLTEFFGESATINQIKKIYEEFKGEGIEKIKENPYIIIYRVEGIGFNIADKLALSSGMKNDDPRRIGAAIVYILKNIAADGHCFCRMENLEAILLKTFQSVPTDKVSDVVVSEITAGNLVLVDDDKLYWKEIYESERDCAIFIKEMLESDPISITTPAIINRAIREFEDENGLSMTDRQADAISLSLYNRISVITGGPGSGKTTIIKGLIKAWNKANTSPFQVFNKSDDRVVLCAPTGKAARRMAETSGMDAVTIHRFVFHGRVNVNSIIVVDEASMLDIVMAARLLRKARTNNCQVVFIGDADQLSPIGPGNFFLDLIKSPWIPTVALDIMHRSVSSISKNAQKINNGQDVLSFVQDDSFSFVPVTKEESQQTVVEAYLDLVEKYGQDNVLCAVPKSQKEKSITSSGMLNDIIREKLNPLTPASKTLPNCFFRENDRIIYQENDDAKELCNGDCGTVDLIDIDEKKIFVRFDNGKLVSFKPQETSNMTIAYAMSTHKAQGSEYKAVIVVQCWHDYKMLSRALLYTAVTRAKERVVLIGDNGAVRAALRNTDNKLRNTRLRELLKPKLRV